METLKIGYRLVQILSLIIFLSQTWVTILKFSHKPVVQEVSVERHEELKYDIYFCHLNGFDADKAMELGYYAPYTYFSGLNKKFDHPTWQGNSSYEETIKIIFNNNYTDLVVGKIVGISNFTLVEQDEIFVPIHGYCRLLRNQSLKEELYIGSTSSLNIMIVNSNSQSSLRLNVDSDSSLQLGVGLVSEDVFYNVLTTVDDSGIHAGESCTDYTQLNYTYEECVDQEYKDMILKWFNCLPPWITDNGSQICDKDVMAKRGTKQEVQDISYEIWRMVTNQQLITASTNCKQPCRREEIRAVKTFYRGIPSSESWIKIQGSNIVSVNTEAFAFGFFRKDVISEF